ncbi:MAG: TonB-dependent receptor [Desulfobacterales bacterium]|nr:TonB-dependent receptor [Desulfobacterales bacterium]
MKLRGLLIKVLALSLCILISGIPSNLLAEETRLVAQLSLAELLNLEITTAGKKSEKIIDIPASVVVVTRNDIKTYGYTTLTQVLEDIPGLFMVKDYYIDNIGIRGFWSSEFNSNIKILVNGVDQVFDNMQGYPIEDIAVPVEAIDRIEVVRGPMSVIYGNGAFFGVVNIITNQPANQYESYTASASIGSHDSKKAFARHSYQEGELKYTFNASYYNTSGIDVLYADLTNKPDTLQYMGVSGDMHTGGRLERQEKYFSLSASFKSFFAEISHDMGENDVMVLPSLLDGSPTNFMDTRVFFGLKPKFSETLSMQGRFSYRTNQRKTNYHIVTPDFFGIFELSSTGYELEMQLLYEPVEVFKILAGINYQIMDDAKYHFNYASFAYPYFENNMGTMSDGEQMKTRSFFIQSDYSPFEKLLLVAGVRMEQVLPFDFVRYYAPQTEDYKRIEASYEEDSVDIIPRLAAILKMNERHTFKLLYGKAISRPSFCQLLEQIENPALSPEKIQTFEFNYLTNPIPSITLNLSVFRNIMDNLFKRPANLAWSSNIGKMQTDGIEATIKAEFLDNFCCELSATWQQTKDKRAGFEDIDVAYSPEFLGYLKLSYLLNNPNIIFGITGRYIGAMESYWDEAKVNADGTQGGRIGNASDGYFTLDANVRYEDLFNKGIFLDVRASNLLNTKIQYSPTNMSSWMDKGAIDQEREFIVSLGWEF